MRVLTVNPGSSSLKLSLLDDGALVTGANLATGAGTREGERLAAAIARMPAPDAVGIRIVHGGRAFREPVAVDDEVIKRLYSLVELAPLHLPLSLYVLGELRRALAHLPMVACFDTAFHANLPEAAATYALPAEWRERFGLRRYGFHGLSHSYATRRAGELLGTDPAMLRIVVCHLGSGASLAAVANGCSVDTTMGFTPLDGLVMATRSGGIDPGIPLWLVRTGLPHGEIMDALEHRSGLRALAGTGDMRQIRIRADQGDTVANAALDVYHHRLRASAAAMTASLGGLDALVFTGGVGENDPALRQRLAEDLAFLGVTLNHDRNATARSDAEISAAGAQVRTVVITAREDLEIAAGVRHALDTR
ncbi:acetate/propionate family kinase [Spirillospora sp. NPDC048911]|uniref:acetate/propionate family kinase n=1 Tax=Spirillospora sp. NPDC048911 TaxID=3364527 RepID=UPI0037120E9C